MAVKGKWAQGIRPRNFHWIIKDQLAICERPGGYGQNHRKVRRQEEIIWIREQEFTCVISIIGAPHNLHNYDELGLPYLHRPFTGTDDLVLWLHNFYAELIKHPRTVVTFSDSGAHVSQIMDASLQTHLLSHWVRARQAITLEQAVRMLSFEPATHWGFSDRGLIREGMAADLLVLDPDTVAPEMPEVVRDLPAGARRLTQRARGLAATVVNGEVVLRDGKPTGALPGQLLRGPYARRS